MTKVKLDRYDLKLMVNCLYKALERYPDELKEDVTDVTLFLLDRHDEIKPGRRRRVCFDAAQLRILVECLNGWRTDLLDAGENWQAEGVSEVLARLVR